MKLFNMLYAFEAEVVHVITESVKQVFEGREGNIPKQSSAYACKKFVLMLQVRHNFKQKKNCELIHK